MLKLSLAVLGGCLLLLTLALSLARQAEPQPAMRVYLRKDGHIYRVWRDRQSGWRKLTERIGQTETYRSLTWSPDGRWILFIDYSLYRMGVQGGPIHQLTDSFDGAPDWSPDGGQIVFQKFGQTGDFDLAVVAADEINALPRLLYASPASEFAPVWSPDGAQVAFVSTQYGNPDIFRYEIATRQLTRLTDYPRAETFPRWSSDGQWVIYETANGLLEQVSLDGQEHRVIGPSTPAAYLYDRSLSPIIEFPWRWILLTTGAIFCLTSAHFVAYLTHRLRFV
jgi:Tol biopolymer transport system component